MPKFDVRGPDPDGAWFVVEIEPDGNERALEETFFDEAHARATAETATDMAARVNGH